jgi:phenylpropionate dioxygenase-like ring-hydroxylating dioxygenase large terminal subunit
MFVSDTHLPHVLPPAAYTDQAWFERELEAVLRPAWWAVALAQELPGEGSFVTFDHLDGPVLLRRSGGRIHAYRNVCPHRLAKLTAKSCGTCPVLRCEYHGWEFDESGATRRIPEAPNFRPLEKGRLGLDRLRVEMVGAVVFLSFVADAPSVRDWLGAEEYARIADGIPSSAFPIWRQDYDVPVNWKVLVENSLESYHVGTVHAGSIGASPGEDDCRHELWDGGSRFTVRSPASTWVGLKGRVARWLGNTGSPDYSHSHIHPGLLRVSIDLGGGFQSVVPTGPRSCRMVYRSVIGQSGTNRIGDFLARRMAASELAVWKRVVDEDLAIVPLVQAGLESPTHPGTGLISRREERITHFQRWLLARLGGNAAGADAVRQGVFTANGAASRSAQGSIP